MLKPYAVDVLLAIDEKVAARSGEAPSGAFSFGYTSVVISGVLGELQIPITTVQPAIWKKAMGLGSSKDLSRARTLELFPATADKLARKKDYDRGEALLMAEWGRRHRT